MWNLYFAIFFSSFWLSLILYFVQYLCAEYLIKRGFGLGFERTYLSLWNFKLCTTCGLFWRKFHRCSVSSAVTVINAPSLTKKTICITAQADSPSCRTWQSTPGFPNLLRQQKSGNGIKEKLILVGGCCYWMASHGTERHGIRWKGVDVVIVVDVDVIPFPKSCDDYDGKV